MPWVVDGTTVIVGSTLSWLLFRSLIGFAIFAMTFIPRAAVISFRRRHPDRVRDGRSGSL